LYVQLESYRNSIIMMKSTLTRKILTIVTGLAVTMMGMSSIEATTAATTSSTVSTQVAPGSNQIAAKKIKRKKVGAMKKGSAMKKGDAMKKQ
jgi:hypothetical protein